jgi:hypothetical protein
MSISDFEKIKILDIFWYTSWGIFALQLTIQKLPKYITISIGTVQKKSLTEIDSKYKNMYITFFLCPGEHIFFNELYSAVFKIQIA